MRVDKRLPIFSLRQGAPAQATRRGQGVSHGPGARFGRCHGLRDSFSRAPLKEGHIWARYYRLYWRYFGFGISYGLLVWAPALQVVDNGAIMSLKDAKLAAHAGGP